MKKAIRVLFLSLISLNVFSQQIEPENRFGISITKDFKPSILSYVPLLNDNPLRGINPSITFTPAQELYKNVQFTLGYSFTKFKVKGNFELDTDNINDEGDLKASVGFANPSLGLKYFLGYKRAKPFVNVNYSFYIPLLSTDGDLDIDNDDFTWDSKDFDKLFDKIFWVDNIILGFGGEYSVNEFISVHGGINFSYFSLTLKVSDAEKYLEQLEDAIDDNDYLSDNIDTDDFDQIDGKAKAKLKYNSSYATLGVSMYF